MSRRSMSVILALFSCATVPDPSFAWGDTANASQQQRDRKIPNPKKTQGATLTGCIDEQDGGKYVLIDPKNRAPLATLEADGFPNEGFAKHIGNTVTVKGSLDSSSRPVMTVRSIETVSDGCGK